MSMNMYMMNLLNGVEALTTDLNLIEKEVQNNDGELLSIEGNLTQMKTRMDKTESNVSSIEAAIQDKLNVLSTLNIHKVNCNQVFIGTSDVSTEINELKESVSSISGSNTTKSYVDKAILMTKAESDAYTNTEILIAKEASELFTISQVQSVYNITLQNHNKIEALQNNAVYYLKSSVDNAFSFINPPVMDLPITSFTSDSSIPNKKYVDHKIVSTINSTLPKHPITHIFTKDDYVESYFDWAMTHGVQYYINNPNKYKVVSLFLKPGYLKSHFTCSFNVNYSFDTNTSGIVIVSAKIKQWVVRPFNGSSMTTYKNIKLR